MVKNGYKQTEIGVIPEDWEVVELGNIVNYIKGFPFKSKDYKQDGVRIIRISDTTYNSIKDNDGIFVDTVIAKQTSKWKLEKGDLIVSTVGSKPPMYDSMVGKVIYIKEKYVGSLLNQNLVMFKNIDDNIQILLSNIFNTKRYVEYIETIFRGNANQASITLDELFKFRIPVPKKKREQQAITEALSDADSWIESLEQLIAKKRLLKQGAMQDLLSPKEDWEVKKLGEIVDFKNGAAHENTVDENGKFVIVNSKFISRNGTVRKYSNAFLCPLYSNEIVMVMSDIPNGKALAKCFIIDEENKYTLNQRICAFKPKENFDSIFLYYKINRNEYFLSFDSGSGQTNLRKDEVLNCPISIPRNQEEQTRIATILSDMDLEIEALQQQLEKARQIKQGMMQELLTGRIRLV